jgi:8-oxo-dGTP pyrophosphatase MutT (NUDIX family)
MGRSVAGARAELEAMLARGVDFQMIPQGQPGARQVRHSAVLILFGALDQVPATSAGGAVDRKLDVLLTRRADTMRHHPGEISFPGGGVDEEDSGAIGAALREAAEETGLDPTGVDVLGTLPEVPIVVSNNLVTPVIGWWTRPSEIAAVDRTEAVEVFRAPVAELIDPANRGTAVFRRAGAEFRSDGFQVREHIVWGFTGVMLSTLFTQLGWAEPWDRNRWFLVNG